MERHKYKVTLRLSEERKDYEAFHDLLDKLIKRLRSWDEPWIRVQFIRRIVIPYVADGKEIDEAFRNQFANLTNQFRRWNDSSIASQINYQIPDHYWQVGKKLDISHQTQVSLLIYQCIYDVLTQAGQLFQVLDGLFTRALLNLPEDEGGRRKDWALHSLILQLKEIWEEGTAKKAGRSRHPHTREIEGPFVRFVRTCLTYLEPEKSYPSLGETISKLLQSETVPLNWKNPPKK